MRKIVLLFLLLAIETIAFSQEITVRFTGQLNGTSYCRLDSVKVTNLTRNWTETVEYPDTIIVLGGTVGTDLNIAATQGLGQNIPNPFDCETRVELSVSQRENVRMQLLDASGRKYADYSGSLDVGVHTFDISAAAPQTYVLNATVGSRSYSIRMVNMGRGCGSSIKYAGISGSITAKLTSTNEFNIGDNMRYIGYATIEGEVVSSTAVERAQTTSEDITLDFIHYLLPTVVTHEASNIDLTVATLNGSVINDGGIMALRGFLYGTSETNLSQDVTCGYGIGNYLANIAELTIGTTYYYKAYATSDVGTAYGELMSFTTPEESGFLNDHEWVDLGLPSGTRWATCNVGATTPEGYGDYFAWGETSTKENYDWSTYIYCEGSQTTFTKYCNNANYGYNGFTDTLMTLEPSDDAATANWGGEWRMPTIGELQELINNCNKDTITRNGIKGLLLTGNNGNSIFLPTSGYYSGSSLMSVGFYGLYWSLNTPTSNWISVEYLWFSYGSGGRCFFYSDPDSKRCNGLAVRPVYPSVGFTPTVETGEATNISYTGARISGNITYDNDSWITARGFVYGTNANDLSNNVECGSGAGSFTANLTDLMDNTTYYYKAYATNGVRTVYGARLSFTTLESHDFVDLGLPSGTLWATCNVGAANPEDFGNYYAWGETTTKEIYNYETYIYAEGSSYNDPRFTKYCDYSYYGNDGFVDSLTTLEMSDDAATVNWGEDWRMPTMDELYELINNCTHEWTTQNGVNGFLFTGINGNSIFFPAASRIEGNSSGSNTGLYWSSSLAGRDAYMFSFNNSGACYVSSCPRVNGLPVRPIRMKATVQTDSAFNIANTSATLAGNVTYDGGNTITSRGFLYGTSSSNLTNRVECGHGTGNFTKMLTGLAVSTTYYYKAYATNSIGTAYGEVRSFTTAQYSEPTGYVNGYGYVDLGLPSGTKWATCNVGASSPTDYGNYYAWGETTPKETYTWETYIYAEGTSDNNPRLTKYNSDVQYGNNGFTDHLRILESTDDAATANWGYGWRMPTKGEMSELLNNCSITRTIQNDVNGFLFTGPNGNSIFLPAAGEYYHSDLSDVGCGFYWSSWLYQNIHAWWFELSSGPRMYISLRFIGASVRPVCAPNGN